MQIRVFDLLKWATDKSKTEFITLNKERKIIQIKLYNEGKKKVRLHRNIMKKEVRNIR